MTRRVYSPILRARAGEIEAIARLSPTAKQSIRPILDYPRQRANDTRSLGSYLSDKVQELAATWGTRDELYFDFSRYEPDLKLPTGEHFVDFVFEIARQARVKAIPVSGPTSIRGPGADYLEAVAQVAAKNSRGLAFRVPFEIFSEIAELKKSIEDSLDPASLERSQIDTFLDAGPLSFGLVNEFDEIELAGKIREAVEYLASEGFRRVVFVGSSLPDSLTRHRKGEVLRVPRTEFRVWRYLVREMSPARVLFGDYGIIHPQQVEPVGPVIPPSRVRTSTEDEYVLHKLGRREIRELSRSALDGGDLNFESESWGENAVRECAEGYGDPGGPTKWITRDTNMHLERTAALVCKYLGIPGGAGSSAGTERSPWLQQSIPLSVKKST